MCECRIIVVSRVHILRLQAVGKAHLEFTAPGDSCSNPRSMGWAGNGGLVSMVRLPISQYQVCACEVSSWKGHSQGGKREIGERGN